MAHFAPARTRAVSEPGRWFIGLSLASEAHGLGGALIRVEGQGLAAAIEVVAEHHISLPPEFAARLRMLWSGSSLPPAAPAALAAELSGYHSEIVAELVQSVPAESVLAVGVHDPGIWHIGDRGPVAWQGLCDSARLAERTGMNIIDAFPQRDLAHDGLGGPLFAVPAWQMLHDSHRTRVLLDLGRTARLTFLPAGTGGTPAARILLFDVGPGMALLDRLAVQLTQGEQRFDPGGRLAVQGRQIPDLLEKWLADPYFEKPLPRWHPRGVPIERFLEYAVRLALDSGWAIQDLLCTATHLVAESLMRAIVRRLPALPVVDELILIGGGQANGMLLRELRAGQSAPVLRISDLGISSEAFEPACAACLAQLHVDQIPANLTAVTGAETPRVLGRPTPGSPQAFHKLVRAMANPNSSAISLRSAV